jgi:hypothetical protein
MDKLWPKNQEGRLMAMISADGNSIGQLLEDIDDPDLYAGFSKELWKIFAASLAYAIQKIPLVDRREGFLRLMPIVAGGDDITLLLPAEHAPNLAVEWATNFADQTKAECTIQDVIRVFKHVQSEQSAQHFRGNEPWPLTLSIGLAIAKPHFPLSAYHRLAQELNKSSKRALFQKSEAEEQGAIDFAVITTATIEALKDLRVRYQYGDESPPYRTARPYTVRQYKTVLALAKQLAQPDGLPRSQRKFLYNRIWYGREAAEEAFQFLYRRSRSFQRMANKQLLFQPDDRTIWLDALELAELLPT